MQRATLFTVFLAIVLFVCSAAEVPQVIEYQGRLTDSGGEPLSGVYTLEFNIYDSETGGTVLWSSGPVSVAVDNGLFNCKLGAYTPLPDDICAGPERWLGITVGTDPEMTPWVKLATVPYAYHALRADSISGDLVMDGDGLGVDVLLGASSAGGDLYLYNDGNDRARLYGSAYGSLYLYDDDYDRTATLDARVNSGGIMILEDENSSDRIEFRGYNAGGIGRLRDGSGLTVFEFDAAQTGPASFTVPEGAVHSDDIYNEPGIASDYTTSVIYLVNGVMMDIKSVSITVPEDGYIFVEAKCSGRCYGSTNANYNYLQIDETSGGGVISPYYTTFGASGFATSTSNYFPVYTQRVYYKSAGTYTFILEGMQSSSSGVDALSSIYYPIITATYFPVSYQTVKAAVSGDEASQFENAVMENPETVPGDGQTQSEPVYEVDLRELELRAAKERAEAEKVERELKEARLRQLEEKNKRPEEVKH